MIKKPLQAQQSAESEGEEGNLNNSHTNANDITQPKFAIFLGNFAPLRLGARYSSLQINKVQLL